MVPLGVGGGATGARSPSWLCRFAPSPRRSGSLARSSGRWRCAGSIWRPRATATALVRSASHPRHGGRQRLGIPHRREPGRSRLVASQTTSGVSTSRVSSKQGTAGLLPPDNDGRGVSLPSRVRGLSLPNARKRQEIVEDLFRHTGCRGRFAATMASRSSRCQAPAG